MEAMLPSLLTIAKVNTARGGNEKGLIIKLNSWGGSFSGEPSTSSRLRSCNEDDEATSFNTILLSTLTDQVTVLFKLRHST